MTSKILVLGSNGFVGRALVRSIQDADVRPISNVDLTSNILVDELLMENGDVDVVFMCADVSMKRWKLDSSRCFSEQLRLQTNVIDAWRRHVSRSKLICFTSHTAWPANWPSLTEENMEDGPLALEWKGYGQCKRTLASQLANVDADWLLLTLGTQFGGDDTSGRFFPYVRNSLRNNTDLLICHGGPEDKRTFAYVEDTVRNIMTCATSTHSRQTINVGGGFDVTVEEMVDVICRVSEVKPHVEYRYSRWNRDVRTLDCSKFERLFTDFERTDLDEAVRKSLAVCKPPDDVTKLDP